MYKVLLAIESEDLLNGITALHIWGELTEFEIAAIRSNSASVYAELKKRRYDLLVAEVFSSDEDENVFGMLKCVRAEGLCRHIALCGKYGDFQSAREGILLGVYEYFVEPFEADRFISLFSRIKNETHGIKATEIYYIEEIADLFENHDSTITEYLKKIADNSRFVQILNSAAKEIFSRYEWLDLFLSETDFCAESSLDAEQKLLTLFEKYCALYPPHNAKIHDVIEYILFNPESDLRQKALSEKLYINSSYLSTMFTAQTDMHFVDYITNVKLHRAAWLLRNTKMKVSEIAERIDYKDIGYFSRQFKKNFGITPSEYRIPDNYQFEI